MNPALKVWYYAGGRIPQKYREFVHDDVTGPKWLVRFTIRSLVQVMPLVTVITLALVFGLGSPWPLAIACGGSSSSASRRTSDALLPSTAHACRSNWAVGVNDPIFFARAI